MNVSFDRRCCLALLAVLAVLRVTGPAAAEQLIRLQNGLTLRGTYVELASIDQNSFSAAASSEGVQAKPIWMVDDGLRRTYIHRRGMVAAEPVDVPDLGQRLTFFQPVPEGGTEIGSMGDLLQVGPFNAYGRRQVLIRGVDGSPMVLMQGITELTGRYAEVQALRFGRALRLDMRIATSTLDSPTLDRLFRHRVDQQDLDRRLEVVRFFIETDRYAEAHGELTRILADFPEADFLRPQLAAMVARQAGQLLDEAELRRDSGQPRLAGEILSRFPLAMVDPQMRIRVQDAAERLNADETQIAETIEQLRGLLPQTRFPRPDALTGIVDEITDHLSPATLPRMADFIRLGTVDDIPVDNRLSLAISGWVLGSGAGSQNLTRSVAAAELRSPVREFLTAADPMARNQALTQIRANEATSAQTMADLVAAMPPPLAGRDVTADPSVDGQWQIVGDSVAGGECLVQLPPEYDPRRPYPCVVALSAAGAEPGGQLDWWAGVPQQQFLKPTASDKSQTLTGVVGEDADDPSKTPPTPPPSRRLGYAGRHGFIVVAPRWSRPGSRRYEYTANEHQAVLRSVRAAMRRFSIDPDAIFLTGHGAGGTAAWDIAISHPDVWAGFVAISCDPDKTIHHYNDNARHVPGYVIAGDKDNAPLRRYGGILDDYMSYHHDAMVVMYRGRGREFFYEEIGRIFEWMKLPAHRRRPIPRELNLASMRRGDHFFWWLEWDQPLPAAVIDPLLWNQTPRLRASPIEASIGVDDEIRITQGPTDRFTLLLTPKMGLDLTEPIVVRYKGRRFDSTFDGDVETMLRDVRGRADRVRPFWHRMNVP